VRRTLATILLVTLALLVATGGYLGYAVVRHQRPVALPPPSGSYPVGRAMFEWTDRARTDPLAPQPGTSRELSVWLWYPAQDSPGAGSAAYAPDAWGGLHFGAPLGLAETDFGGIGTHSLDDVPVAAGRFPIVVLEPGLGLAAPQYTALAENLASHGYLVAGVTPSYSANLTVLHGRPVGSTPAGNPPAFDAADLHTGLAAKAAAGLLEVWVADARFAAAEVAGLDRAASGEPAATAGRFAGHVDGARTAYVGHSFGGAASLGACRADPHCAGAVDLDGTQFGPVVRTGLDKPLMIWGSEGSCVTGACEPETAADASDRDTARSLLAAGSGRAWCFQLDGSKHFDFTDYAAYYLAAPLRQLLPLGGIDGGLGLTIVNTYVAAFLDQVLLSSPEPLLTAEPPPYPQVRALRTPAR
jgi:predicted dienelactone hydrolase